MASPAARQDVIKAAHLAASRGARVVGLGALTAPATGGGLTILDEIPRGVILTNGNALTAAIVRQNVSEAAQYLSGRDGRKAVVAIVGCTGSVGSATTQRLAADGFELLLIGRSPMRVERQFSDLQSATFSGQVADIKHADVVVLLTNDPAALVTPDTPASGSIVIDCSQPANIPRDRYPEFAQLGIAVVEGGLVRIPEYSSTDDFGFSDPTVTFACLAEAYLLARSGSREHSVGRCAAEKAVKMEQLAARFGVEACRLDMQLQKCAHAS
jgi:predicted amino acid dehydrogenase